MKKLLALAAIATSLILSGCGTLLTRGPVCRWIDRTNLYPATSFDAEVIYRAVKNPLDEQWYLDLPSRPVIGIFWVADLMPSLLVDTIMLPYDFSEIQPDTKNKQ